MDNGFCSAKYLGLILAIIASMATLTDAPAAPPTKDDPHSGVTQNWDKALPAGHWTATTDAMNPANAWVVGFATPGVGTIGKTTSNFPVWCVRGPMNADQY